MPWPDKVLAFRRERIFCIMFNQITGGLDVSALPPEPIRDRAQTERNNERTVFVQRRWQPEGSQDSETLVYDTKRQVFVLKVQIERAHVQSKAFYRLTPAQAIEWTLLRHAGPHTLNAAKEIIRSLREDDSQPQS